MKIDAVFAASSTEAAKVWNLVKECAFSRLFLASASASDLRATMMTSEAPAAAYAVACEERQLQAGKAWIRSQVTMANPIP